MSRQADADALGRELVRLVRLVDRTRADCAAQCSEGLERAAYLLLARLVAEGPQRLSTLAEAAQLVALELVQRRPDP